MPLFGLKWAEQEQANRYQFCKTSFGQKVPWASSNLSENLTVLTMVDGNLCLWIISYVARRTISYLLVHCINGSCYSYAKQTQEEWLTSDSTQIWQPMVIIRLAPPGGTLFTLRLQNSHSLQSQNGNNGSRACTCNLRLLCVTVLCRFYIGRGDQYAHAPKYFF